MIRAALLRFWILPGWLLGLAVASYLALGNEMAPPFDADLARLYFACSGSGALLGASFGAVAGVAVGLVAAALARFGRAVDPLALHLCLAAGVWPAWLAFATTRLDGLGPASVVRKSAVAALVLLLAPALAWLASRRWPLARVFGESGSRWLQPALTAGTLLVLGGLAALALSSTALVSRYSTPGVSRLDLPPVFAGTPGLARDGEPGRLIVIGVDALDWSILNRLLETGRAPNLARLIADGVHGDLASFDPTWSPRIWTSVFTGRRPEAHGVLKFAEVRYPRLGLEGLFDPTPLVWLGPVLDRIDPPERVPITSRSRRVKAIWNLCSEAGIRIGAVNWWATWPSEPVLGFVVSDAAHDTPRPRPRQIGADGAAPIPRRSRTFPERAIADLGAFQTRIEDVGPEVLEPFVDLTPGDRARFADLVAAKPPAKGGPDEGKVFRTLTHAILRDAFTTRSAIHLRDRYRPDVLLVYLQSYDWFGHMVYAYSAPDVDRYDYEPDDVRRFRHSMERVAVWIDGLVGEILAGQMDGRTTAVVMSDHGWWTRHQRAGRPVYDHDGAPPGLFIAAGRGIQRGGRVEGADILDVAPTLFHLLGLPLSEELDGEVLEGIFEPGYLAAHPTRTIPSYEGAVDGATASGAPAKGEQMIENLRALGYIE